MSSFYDSAAPTRIVHDTFFSLWKYRELIQILVKRDLAVRYKRSSLGLLWTLLNPLLTSLVLWFVFITIFSSRLPSGTKFAPYLLSGVLIVTFFTQGFSQAADSIAHGSGILKKVYVPPQVFALAGAISNAVNFLLGSIALALISLISGDGISYLAPLTLVIILFMLMYTTGLGLIISILYIRYDDTRNIIAILISFMMYLSPIFYPKEILSGEMLFVVNANPLTSYLDIFRFVFSNSGNGTINDWLYVIATSTIIFFLGIQFFSKFWPKTVVML